MRHRNFEIIPNQRRGFDSTGATLILPKVKYQIIHIKTFQEKMIRMICTVKFVRFCTLT